MEELKIKIAQKAGRCPSCRNMVEIGEEYVSIDCGAFVRKCHEPCAKKILAKRKEKESKESKEEKGGSAGSYHSTGGRVIRGTNSINVEGFPNLG